jgi:hypothetical protein
VSSVLSGLHVVQVCDELVTGIAYSPVSFSNASITSVNQSATVLSLNPINVSMSPAYFFYRPTSSVEGAFVSVYVFSRREIR